MVFPYESSNVSLNSEIVFEFPHAIDPKSVTESSITLTDCNGGPKISVVMLRRALTRIFFRPREHMPEGVCLQARVRVEALRQPGRSQEAMTATAELTTVEHSEGDEFVIYEAINGGRGYPASFAAGAASPGVAADHLCDTDAARPNDQNPPPVGVNPRVRRVFKA